MSFNAAQLAVAGNPQSLGIWGAKQLRHHRHWCRHGLGIDSAVVTGMKDRDTYRKAVKSAASRNSASGGGRLAHLSGRSLYGEQS